MTIILHPYSKTLPYAANADHLFSNLTQGGQKSGSILYQTPRFSLGIYQPSISIQGKHADFCLQSHDERGITLLATCAAHLFKNASVHTHTETEIRGQLSPDYSLSTLEERLYASNHTHFLRHFLFTTAASSDELHPEFNGGLVGVFGYDFIRQLEELPPAQQDTLQDPDYLFYLATRYFIVDHERQLTQFVTLRPSCLSVEDDQSNVDINRMLGALTTPPTEPTPLRKLGILHSDTSMQEYSHNVQQLQTHIAEGDIFQAVYGRMLSGHFSGDPLTLYQQLKKTNPSPFHFYFRDDNAALVGASPELAVRMQANTRRVDITPIAGSKPRGRKNTQVDPHLDARYSISLQTDAKELAEHTMLIDLARNDIASIAKPGTTQVDEAFTLKKFSHIQHLVSKVSGTVRDSIDALAVYAATMNMGTLSGAPKVRAMQLLTQFEKNARGFFGGAMGYLANNGNLETSIIIRSLRIKNDRVYLRAASGIVADSIPENEWYETEHKLAACIRVLQEHCHAN